MDRTRIARSAGVFCLALAVVACVAFVALTQGAAPRGGQLQIARFGIGEGYQRAYIPRRAQLHLENGAPYDILLGQFGRRVLAESQR